MPHFLNARYPSSGLSAVSRSQLVGPLAFTRVERMSLGVKIRDPRARTARERSVAPMPTISGPIASEKMQPWPKSTTHQLCRSVEGNGTTLPVLLTSSSCRMPVVSPTWSCSKICSCHARIKKWLPRKKCRTENKVKSQKEKGKYEPKKMKFESAISLKHFFSYNLKY